MLNIHTSYHLTHFMKDLPESTSVYKKVFDTDITPPGYHAGEDRDASFLYVSDCYIELFCSRDAKDPEPTSNGGKFIKRWGESLANFGWLVDDDIPDAISDMESKELNLVYVAGGQSAFFVHPRQAYGMMLEVGHYTPHEGDPRHETGYADRWLNHPLGIRQMHCVTFAVNDLSGALDTLNTMTGQRPGYRGMNEGTGRESAYLWFTDHMLEITTPIEEDTAIGRAVPQPGPKIESCTFRVQDLDRTADYLRSTDMGVIGEPSEGRIAIDPSGIQGAMYLFTDRSIPNDPRGN